jgi:ATP-binding cassette, subfamily G (WHITE), member 2, PDR
VSIPFRSWIYQLTESRFLDEPTSGLDSQTSWSLCNLLEKLTQNGQAILCTIHQPSAILFQRFDRLLLLAKGGKTVYFGDIGRGSRTLINYFVRHGASDCPLGANPAEYMLEAIGAAPGSQNDIDWPEVWRQSSEYRNVRTELYRLKELAPVSTKTESTSNDFKEFAAPYSTQAYQVFLRTFQQYWRTPAYIYSKLLMTVGSSMFIGLSFLNSENTQRGLQNQLFGCFVFLFVIIQLILQIIPMFVVQRTLYESRERQSRTMHWSTFVLANIFCELVWNSFAAIFCFLTWYYPMGLYRNAEWTDAVHSRSTLALLLIWTSFMFASSFANAVIAGIDSDEIASAIANILSIMMYGFCGLLATSNDLPGFWIFMYRVNPFTYLVDAFLSTTLAHAPVRCAPKEYLQFVAPENQTCQTYLAPYLDSIGGAGALVSPDATGVCSYCPISNTDQFLSTMNLNFNLRWRNFGILWVFVIFNLGAAVALYKIFRVPNKKKSREQKAT